MPTGIPPPAAAFETTIPETIKEIARECDENERAGYCDRLAESFRRNRRTWNYITDAGHVSNRAKGGLAQSAFPAHFSRLRVGVWLN